MHPDICRAVHADQPPGLGPCSPADEGNQGVPPDEPPQLRACLFGHVGKLRSRDDRRQRSVDVEQDRRAVRRLGQTCKQSARILHDAQNTDVRLVAIGVAAGFFSALLGVGGGVLIVPLLILAVRFGERNAMATSLAAAFLIALAGSVTYALHGELKPGAAAIVGLPAAAGAVAGTALQQRLSGRFLSLAFALLLTGVGVRLLV